MPWLFNTRHFQIELNALSVREKGNLIRHVNSRTNVLDGPEKAQMPQFRNAKVVSNHGGSRASESTYNRRSCKSGMRLRRRGDRL
jgi:hypothetical protein